MPSRFPPLCLSASNISTLFRPDYQWQDLFRAWSLFAMVSITTLETFTFRALLLGEISELDSLAGGALVNTSTKYTVFKDDYRALVNSRTLVELLIGGDISQENWEFEEDPSIINQNKLASFMKSENVFLVSRFLSSPCSN